MLNISNWLDGYLWGTLLFPVEWYFLKPSLMRLYKDALYYVNPILNKMTGKNLPDAV